MKKVKPRVPRLIWVDDEDRGTRVMIQTTREQYLYELFQASKHSMMQKNQEYFDAKIALKDREIANLQAEVVLLKKRLDEQFKHLRNLHISDICAASRAWANVLEGISIKL